jgi:hypothetical protein
MWQIIEVQRKVWKIIKSPENFLKINLKILLDEKAPWLSA